MEDATSFQGDDYDRFQGDKTGNWKKIDGQRKKKSHQSLFGDNYTTMPGPAFFQPSQSLCPSISDKGTIRPH